jgi:hypothetical protein
MSTNKKVLVNPISGSVFTVLALGDVALFYFKVIGTIPFVIILACRSSSSARSASPTSGSGPSCCGWANTAA